MSKKLPILYGTDPEMFATYEKEGKLFTLPPYFFREALGVKASDDKRHPVFIESPEFKFHEDGAAFEMSVLPSHNPKELFDRVQECKRIAEEVIISQFPEHCLPKLRFLPMVGFDVKRWEKMPEDFFMSTTFGCDPDVDAFNTETKEYVIDASKHPERYGGGHIHFSGSKFIESDPISAIKLLAITVGLAAVKYTDVPALERARTFLYGKPGKFRIQRYGKKNPFGKNYAFGIEYRTVSNTWAKDWSIAEKIFDWGKIAVESLLGSDLGNNLVKELSPIAVNAITECDQVLATELLAQVESRV